MSEHVLFLIVRRWAHVAVPHHILRHQCIHRVILGALLARSCVEIHRNAACEAGVRELHVAVVVAMVRSSSDSISLTSTRRLPRAPPCDDRAPLVVLLAVGVRHGRGVPGEIPPASRLAQHRVPSSLNPPDRLPTRGRRGFASP